jgi:hypothetical protein
MEADPRFEDAPFDTPPYGGQHRLTSGDTHVRNFNVHHLAQMDGSPVPPVLRMRHSPNAAPQFQNGSTVSFPSGSSAQTRGSIGPEETL